MEKNEKAYKTQKIKIMVRYRLKINLYHYKQQMWLQKFYKQLEVIISIGKNLHKNFGFVDLIQHIFI